MAHTGEVIVVQLPKSLSLMEIILAGLAYGAPICCQRSLYKTRGGLYLEDAQASLFICEAHTKQARSSMKVHQPEITQYLSGRVPKQGFRVDMDQSYAALYQWNNR